MTSPAVARTAKRASQGTRSIVLRHSQGRLSARSSRGEFEINRFARAPGKSTSATDACQRTGDAGSPKKPRRPQQNIQTASKL